MHHIGTLFADTGQRFQHGQLAEALLGLGE
jgi:hypothetical protein